MDIGTHHVHLRQRLYKNLEQYPHQEPLKRFFDYLMYGVGVLAPIALLPQAAQIYINHSVAGLSLFTFSLLVGINILWTMYGILHRETPIILSNLGLMLLNTAIVVGILAFR